MTIFAQYLNRISEKGEHYLYNICTIKRQCFGLYLDIIWMIFGQYSEKHLDNIMEIFGKCLHIVLDNILDIILEIFSQYFDNIRIIFG